MFLKLVWRFGRNPRNYCYRDAYHCHWIKERSKKLTLKIASVYQICFIDLLFSTIGNFVARDRIFLQVGITISFIGAVIIYRNCRIYGN